MRASPVPDRMLILDINNKLARGGIRSPCKVSVQARSGDITLTGTVENLFQQQTALKVASGVNGVRRVNSQVTIKPRIKH